MPKRLFWLMVATCVASQVAGAAEVVPPKSEAELAPGMFLVASRHLNDPNFSETVILLISYSDEGALGVIINRPTDVAIAKLLPEFKNRTKQKDFVYIGGPVDRTQMVLLARAKKQPEGSEKVSEGIYLISGKKTLQRLVKENSTQFRAYVGYAGWAP